MPRLSYGRPHQFHGGRGGGFDAGKAEALSLGDIKGLGDLLSDYVAVGLSPEVFWGLTIGEFALHMKGAFARLERDNRIHKETAWLTATLTRADKIPPLHDLLAFDEPRDPEEVAAERRAQLRTFSATLPKRTWEEWRQR